MLKFKLPANIVAGISHVINQLSPADKASIGGDAVDANMLVLHAIDDIDKANEVFLKATKETEDKKQACFNKFSEVYQASQAGATPEETSRLASKLNAEMKPELDRIDKESKADASVMVEVELSNEKMEAIQKLFPKTVSQWNDSKTFVEAGKALKEAA